MSEDPSTLPTALIDAYQQTHYRVFTHEPITLKAGEHSYALALLYKQHDVVTGAFITAWNPYSKKTTLADNERRQDQLKAQVSSLELSYIEGEGRAPDGQWEGEPSLFILGISQSEADKLARHYEQNAYVWTDQACCPELRLLR